VGGPLWAIPFAAATAWTAQGDEDNPLKVDPRPAANVAPKLHDSELNVFDHDVATMARQTVHGGFIIRARTGFAPQDDGNDGLLS